MTNRALHRWLSVLGVLFFLSVSLTGLWMQGEEVFGDEEAAREAASALVSPATLDTTLLLDAASLNKARTTLQSKYGNRHVAGIDWIIKAPVPAYVFHLDGKDAIKVTVNAATGAIISSREDGNDLVKRIHTGEILGDAGKFLGLAWGSALVIMSITGTILYLQMMRRRSANAAQPLKGWRRFFW